MWSYTDQIIVRTEGQIIAENHVVKRIIISPPFLVRLHTCSCYIFLHFGFRDSKFRPHRLLRFSCSNYQALRYSREHLDLYMNIIQNSHMICGSAEY